MIVDDVTVVPFQCCWVVPLATGPTSVVSRRTMGERGQQEADRHPHDQHCTPWGQEKEKRSELDIKVNILGIWQVARTYFLMAAYLIYRT